MRIVIFQMRHYLNGLYSLLFTSVKLNTIKMLRRIMVAIISDIKLIHIQGGQKCYRSQKYYRT